MLSLTGVNRKILVELGQVLDLMVEKQSLLRETNQ